MHVCRLCGIYLTDLAVEHSIAILWQVRLLRLVTLWFASMDQGELITKVH